MRSRRKFLWSTFLLIALLAFLLQIVVSAFVFSYKKKMINRIKDLIGYDCTVKDVGFSVLRGIHIKDLSVYYSQGQKPVIYLPDTYISVKILPLFSKLIKVHFLIPEADLRIKNEKEGVNFQVILSDLTKHSSSAGLSMNTPAINAFDIYVNRVKIRLLDNPDIRENGLIILRNTWIRMDADKFYYDGVIGLSYSFSKEANLRQLIKVETFYQELTCSTRGRIQGKDLFLDTIFLNLDGNEIFGSGVNCGFAERNPDMNIYFPNAALALDNLSSLKEIFSLNGTAIFNIRMSGPMNDPRLYCQGLLHDCGLIYNAVNNEVSVIKKINARITYQQGTVRFDNSSLLINSLPLHFQLSTAIGNAPVLHLLFWLSREYFSRQNIPLEKVEIGIDGKINKNFSGDVILKFLYKRKGDSIDIAFNFKDSILEYANPRYKFLSAKGVDLSIKSSSGLRNFRLSDFSSRFKLIGNILEMQKLTCSGYGGKLMGRMKADVSQHSYLSFLIEGADFQVEKVLSDAQVSGDPLSGIAGMSVDFDNRRKEFMDVVCMIRKGRIDLDSISAAIKLPSMKNVAFEEISAGLAVLKSSINIKQARLVSQDINLNASLLSDDKIEGRLGVSIASSLLQKSEPFRKLLSITEIKDPFIDFDFNLGGSIQHIRIEWLKGEFRDKIKERLPGFIKRGIENELNKSIDDLSND